MNSQITWLSGTNLETELGAASWLETSRALRKMGWDVTLVAEGPSGWRTIRGEKVYCIPRSENYFLGSVLFHLRLFRYIVAKRTSIDILFFHQMAAIWIFLFQFLFRFRGWKFPLTVMDTRDIPKYGLGPKFRLREHFFKLSHAAANILASGQTAITLKMADYVKIPPQRLLGTWPSGVTIDHFNPAIESRGWPLEDDPVRLIYTGTFHYDRKLLPLCKAVLQTNANGMKFVLTLLGDGPQREALQDFAGHSEGCVVVEKYVAYADVPKFLQNAHIGVTPLPDSNDQRFEISSPIKMFEYMASGLAILTTSNICHLNVVGGRQFAFWAADGRQGDLFQSLREIWERRLDLQAMGREAAMAAADWTWEESATKLSKALIRGLRKNQPDEVVLDLKEAEQ